MSSWWAVEVASRRHMKWRALSHKLGLRAKILTERGQLGPAACSVASKLALTPARRIPDPPLPPPGGNFGPYA